MNIGRPGVAAFAATILACSVVLVGPAAQAADAGLVQVAKLDSALGPTVLNEERYLEIDAPARRLFEIGQPQGGTGMRVVAFDLDTLQKIAAIDIPDARRDSRAGGQRSVVDELHHRMYVLYAQSRGPVLDAVADQTTGHLVFALAVIDTLSLKLIGSRPLLDLLPTPNDASGSNGTTGVKAIGYYAPEDRLYVVTEESAVRSGVVVADRHGVIVHELDASNLLSDGSRRWSYPVAACASVMGTHEQSAVLRIGDAIFIPCQVPKLGFLIDRDPRLEVSGIAQVNIVPNSSPLDIGNFSVDFHPLGGDLTQGPVAIDPASGRLIMRNDGADISEAGILIFDASRTAALAKILGPFVLGLGVDPAQGRMYAISQPDAAETGDVTAIVESTRGLRVGQGRAVKTRLHAQPAKAELPRVIVDPLRRRLFWELGSPFGSTGSVNTGYAVIEDRIPPEPAERPEDPDANTLDVSEGSGTDVNFSGGSRAYGSRVRVVNGTGGPLRNLDQPIPELDDIIGFYVSPDTRDLRFGRVSNASLGNTEASARAIGAEFDPATAAELDEVWRNVAGSAGAPDAEPSPGDEQDTQTPLEELLGPSPEAACADFSGEPAREQKPRASASCDLRKARIDAAADHRLALPGLDNPGGIVVEVGFARSTSSTVRDRQRGVVSIAEAEAREVLIEVPGAVSLQIGRVYTRAETFARGRRGTAGSTPFIREIEDVVLRLPNGASQQLCSGPCDVSALAAALNRALGTRLRIQFPRYDLRRAKGTPGGYEALLVRDPFEQVNDQLVNLEGDDAGLEVPGMQITIFADGRVSSRVVVYLAATSAESHYGIYRLPTDQPPGIPPVVSVPGLGGGGSLPDGSAPPTSNGGGGPLGELIRRTVKSFTFFLASPGQSVRAFLFWVFLVSPLLLLRRRRMITARRPR